MGKFLTGIVLCVLGVCLLLFKTQSTVLLLGGPATVQQSVWIEDRQAHEKVSRWVGRSGWTLLVAGIANLAIAGIVARMRGSGTKPRRQ
jgi:hypothetical protein